MKVNAQGGTVEPATTLDRTKHSTHRWPWFLPDFLFLATSHTGADPKQNGIYFGSLDNKETRLIVNADSAFYKDQTDDFFACPINAKGSEIAVGKPQRLFHASSPGIGSSFDGLYGREAPSYKPRR